MDEERTRFQKIVLLILAGMAVLFAVLTAVSRAQKGAYFEGTLLRPENPAQNVTAYTGRVHGTPVTITVTQNSETRFTVGSKSRASWTTSAWWITPWPPSERSGGRRWTASGSPKTAHSSSRAAMP